MRTKLAVGSLALILMVSFTVFAPATGFAKTINLRLAHSEPVSNPRHDTCLFFVKRAEDSPWHGGGPYVDLLLPGVTQKFIEVTLEAYKREVGSEFGKRIPGSFTDEPQIQPAGGLPWTEDLAEQFQKRWGYSLIDNLPALRQAMAAERTVSAPTAAQRRRRTWSSSRPCATVRAAN